jgi:TfoX/Sxy family transcriptional regulator of competence genes
VAQPYLDNLASFVELHSAVLPKNIILECRHFFSGAALYANGRICATLTPAGLAIKLAENSRHRLFQNKMAMPLRYFANGPVKKEYVLFSTGIDDSEDMLIGYIIEGINYVLSLTETKTGLGHS